MILFFKRFGQCLLHISLVSFSTAPSEDQPDVSVVLSAYSQQGDPALYEVYYSGLKRFIESVLDCHRAELSQVFYPLFVHMYLELVYNNHENEAKAFFEKWVSSFYLFIHHSFIHRTAPIFIFFYTFTFRPIFIFTCIFVFLFYVMPALIVVTF